MQSLIERTITFKLVGFTPLLMHNPSGMTVRGSAKTKRIPPPEEEAAAGLYASEAGKLYVKFIAIRSCMLQGAKAFKIGRMSAARFLGGCLLDIDLEAPCWLYHPKTKQLLTTSDYVLDIRRVMVQGQGILRARPKILEWETDVSFLVDVRQVSRPEQIDQALFDALEHGGQVIGIGDYRPEKGGPFGRFTVELLNGEKQHGESKSESRRAASTANGGTDRE